jgi:hypothetical protein
MGQAQRVLRKGGEAGIGSLPSRYPLELACEGLSTNVGTFRIPNPRRLCTVTGTGPAGEVQSCGSLWLNPAQRFSFTRNTSPF